MFLASPAELIEHYAHIFKEFHECELSQGDREELQNMPPQELREALAHLKSYTDL